MCLWLLRIRRCCGYVSAWSLRGTHGISTSKRQRRLPNEGHTQFWLYSPNSTQNLDLLDCNSVDGNSEANSRRLTEEREEHCIDVCQQEKDNCYFCGLNHVSCKRLGAQMEEHSGIARYFLIFVSNYTVFESLKSRGQPADNTSSFHCLNGADRWRINSTTVPSTGQEESEWHWTQPSL